MTNVLLDMFEVSLSYLTYNDLTFVIVEHIGLVVRMSVSGYRG